MNRRSTRSRRIDAAIIGGYVTLLSLALATSADAQTDPRDSGCQKPRAADVLIRGSFGYRETEWNGWSEPTRVIQDVRADSESPRTEWADDLYGQVASQRYHVGPPPAGDPTGCWVDGQTMQELEFESGRLRYRMPQHTYSVYSRCGVNIHDWSTSLTLDFFVKGPSRTPFTLAGALSGFEALGRESSFGYRARIVGDGRTIFDGRLLDWTTHAVAFEGRSTGPEIVHQGQVYSRAVQVEVSGANGIGYSHIIRCPIVPWNTSIAAVLVYLEVAPGGSLLFRESDHSGWRNPNIIPGWDHVALKQGGEVWESHPGYPAGCYYDPEVGGSVSVSEESAVQWVHSPGSFIHDSRTITTGAVSAEIIIPAELARDMAEITAGLAGAPFRDPPSLSCLLSPPPPLTLAACLRSWLDPNGQKGYERGDFTCIGLVEGAAERAGHQGGQGFIPNNDEWITVFGVKVFPALTPQLLYSVLNARESSSEWERPLQGVCINDGDWVLLDPLGRQMGVIDGIELNEIPEAELYINGSFAHYIILDPVAGNYEIELFGVGTDVASFVGNRGRGDAFEGVIAGGERVLREFEVPQLCRADCDYSGELDFFDFICFQVAFASGDPYADCDGNGEIDFFDILCFQMDYAVGCP